MGNPRSLRREPRRAEQRGPNGVEAIPASQQRIPVRWLFWREEQPVVDPSVLRAFERLEELSAGTEESARLVRQIDEER